MAKKLTPAEQAIVSASDAGHQATTVALAARILDLTPDNLRVLIDAGHACWHLARYEVGEKYLQQAIEICEPKKRDVIFGELGNLFRAKGDFDVAAQWYQQQIDTDPTDATGYLFLGSLWLQQGKQQPAVDVLRRGLDCEIGCMEEVHFTLGLALRSLNQLDEAAIHFQKALEIDVNYTVAKVALKDVKSARSI